MSTSYDAESRLLLEQSWVLVCLSVWWVPEPPSPHCSPPLLPSPPAFSPRPPPTAEEAGICMHPAPWKGCPMGRHLDEGLVFRRNQGKHWLTHPYPGVPGLPPQAQPLGWKIARYQSERTVVTSTGPTVAGEAAGGRPEVGAGGARRRLAWCRQSPLPPLSSSHSWGPSPLSDKQLCKAALLRCKGHEETRRLLNGQLRQLDPRVCSAKPSPLSCMA